MIVEVIAVGTELLLGQVVNTNATWLGSRIADEGWDALFDGAIKESGTDIESKDHGNLGRDG